MTCVASLRQKPYFAACCAWSFSSLAFSASAILALEALLSVFFFSAFSASSTENSEKNLEHGGRSETEQQPLDPWIFGHTLLCLLSWVKLSWNIFVYISTQFTRKKNTIWVQIALIEKHNLSPLPTSDVVGYPKNLKPGGKTRRRIITVSHWCWLLMDQLQLIETLHYLAKQLSFLKKTLSLYFFDFGAI